MLNPLEILIIIITSIITHKFIFEWSTPVTILHEQEKLDTSTNHSLEEPNTGSDASPQDNEQDVQNEQDEQDIPEPQDTTEDSQAQEPLNLNSMTLPSTTQASLKTELS